MELDLFLFDLSGTTVRDDGLVPRTLREVGGAAASAVDDAWLRARRGFHKEALFREMLARAGLDPRAAPELAREFARRLSEGWRANPPAPLRGAVESMQRLRELGIKFGFTTGFSRETAQEILALLGWRPDVLVASDEVARGRPAPDMILEAMRRTGVGDARRVGVAGDTPADLQAGTNAGCRIVVGVAHGTHTLGELAQHPHTVLLPDLMNLVDVLEAAG